MQLGACRGQRWCAVACGAGAEDHERQQDKDQAAHRIPREMSGPV
jgi:hypothetical protein